ncbi:MAG: C4-dicarboxylate transporter DcuC [Fimbriiglobus sp.]
MIWLALIIIAVAVYAVLQGLDVRLVLLIAALLLGATAGDVQPIVRTFIDTFAAEKFVIPICSAMGFAYVLRATKCDQHMVRVLMSPVKLAPWALVPGVVLAGFVTNIPIISQASSAVCLGTVVVPLMRAAGYSPIAIGTALLLGCSVGGELLNPGAPELNTVSQQTGTPTQQIIPHIVPLIFPMLGVVTLVFWALSFRDRQPAPEPTTTPEASTERLNPFKAAIPLIPLVLLFLSGPPFSVFEISPDWVLPKGHKGSADSRYTGRLIGLAMLIGTLVATLFAGRDAKTTMKSYFEGAGYGFANIVSIIVVATCFGKAIELVGLDKHLESWIQANPGLLHPLAGWVPFGFAWVSGSGMATTQSLYGFFYNPAVNLNVNPLDVGAMVSVGSAAGRTMSPAAAVVFMCATLSGANGPQLVKRAAIPLLAGLLVIVVLRTLAVI